MGEVMVTGATGGIGRAVVTELAGAGHQVSAVGRDPDAYVSELSVLAAPDRN